MSMSVTKKNLEARLRGAKRIAVLGIGSEFLMDDGAGLAVAEELKDRISAKGLSKKAKVFFGGTAPENLTGQIRKFRPTHLIAVDCADFGKAAGSIGVFDPAMDEGISFSTHRLPLSVLAAYLEKTLSCNTVLVAIQAKTVKFSPRLSSKVKASVGSAASMILRSLENA